ncbi:MAG: hypothetical protein Q7S33_03320 [Nanoarchaeota archaeon]|nr:hypothetical protein [Nanoarchaeota archaeon]
MILILGFPLIYWTGILTGLFFILSFLGCCCHSKLCRYSIFERIRKYHKTFIYFAFIFFIIHLVLAILTKYGIVI